MITDRGFVFNGRHSSEFNIYCDPASRQLIPEKRRLFTVVPGRSGSYAQEDGAYNVRTESFNCWYTRQPGTDIAQQAREIAAWLSENGELRFDSEPDKYYKAYFTGAPPLAKHLLYGEFTLTFAYSPPFAFGEQQSVTLLITGDTDVLPIQVLGTAATPCRIIIDNIGDTTIENLRITHQHN